MCFAGSMTPSFSPPTGWHVMIILFRLLFRVSSLLPLPPASCATVFNISCDTRSIPRRIPSVCHIRFLHGQMAGATVHNIHINIYVHHSIRDTISHIYIDFSYDSRFVIFYIFVAHLMQMKIVHEWGEDDDAVFESMIVILWCFPSNFVCLLMRNITIYRHGDHCWLQTTTLFFSSSRKFIFYSYSIHACEDEAFTFS